MDIPAISSTWGFSTCVRNFCRLMVPSFLRQPKWTASHFLESSGGHSSPTLSGSFSVDLGRCGWCAVLPFPIVWKSDVCMIFPGGVAVAIWCESCGPLITCVYNSTNILPIIENQYINTVFLNVNYFHKRFHKSDDPSSANECWGDFLFLLDKGCFVEKWKKTPGKIFFGGEKCSIPQKTGITL